MPSEDSASVEVSIYDSNFNRLFKETVAGTNDLRRYNLSQLAQGDYRIKMNAGGKEFIQFVAVK
jgi:hypothetical protein